MSKPNVPLAQPIPTGILVSAPSMVCPAKEPAPKRKATRRAPASQIPWLWIVTLGSVAWAAFVLAIGLCTGQGEASQPDVPRPAFVPVAVAAPSTKPTAQEPIDDFEVVSDPKPIAEAPKLPMRWVEVARNDTLPPAITFEPDLVEVTPLRPKPKPRNERKGEAEPRNESNAQKAQPRPLRKDVDLNVFASCEQIGTNILFMKNPADAFRKAREEKKLVFMVHLSGNLEDKEFT
jgi:hypothetical protein